MSKLSLFHLCVVSNYINNKIDYLKLMMTTKKFENLNTYFNQFKANPPFEDNKLFTEKYTPYNHKHELICIKYDRITTDIDETELYDIVYFNNYSNVKSINIFTNELFISNEVMNKTKKLNSSMIPLLYAKDCYLDKNTTFISKKIFKRSLIENFHLEQCTKLTEISSFSMNGFCTKNIYLPTTIKCLKAGCFENCNFETIKLPDSLTSIEYAVFSRNNSLTELEIPKSVVKIDLYSIVDCYNLKRLIEPEHIIKSMDLDYLKIPNIEFN